MVYIDGEYVGDKNIKEIVSLEKEAYKNASDRQRKEQADHMIYGYRKYNEAGELEKVHIYYHGFPLCDEKFYKRVNIEKSLIKAIHKRK